jgi:hypothetical protein
MRGLRRRLQKLEGTIGVKEAAPSFAVRWGAVFKTALAKLSIADRDLLQERMAIRIDKRTEAHESVWVRWKSVHATVVRETGWESYMDPGDWWL